MCKLLNAKKAVGQTFTWTNEARCFAMDVMIRCICWRNEESSLSKYVKPQAPCSLHYTGCKAVTVLIYSVTDLTILYPKASPPYMTLENIWRSLIKRIIIRSTGY